jgi:hypothetical protein
MSATTVASSAVWQIGEAAGALWRLLDQEGPQSVARLVKTSGLPRDLAMQALGWLAREDKVAIDDEGRSRLVSLTD